MNQYNYPTTILSGQGALKEFGDRLKGKSRRHPLIVTDKTIKACGVLDKLTVLLTKQNIPFHVFDEIHPNPVEEDVEKGTAAYHENNCDSIIAIGGGSPMDAAKAIRIMVVHPKPLAQYDDATGGDQKITRAMPPLYAIPTTAGTGSEVGRSAVIILKDTGKKTIFFHPDLIPDIAVLEPELTAGLPKEITAATGIDAFVHCLETYFAPGLHPMADGIAKEGMELILEWLPAAVADGNNLTAREMMLLAASMGAVAFQKGLGMIHSLAHPLSSRFDIHHGLANAVLLPAGIAFLERADLTQNQKEKIAKVKSMLFQKGIQKETLWEGCQAFLKHIGIQTGLSGLGIREEDLDALSAEAFEDPCHQNNMIPVDQKDLLRVYQEAL
ncbi:MAG: iron-containing alcohol dehydrogenase [Desulfobacterales bacterium]